MYSVIIPSLGRLEYINELIVSILSQTVQPCEILILLDDNKHCREISSSIIKDESLRIFYCVNLNLAEKRNFGASMAASENLIFSDDDDLWAPTRGEMVCKALLLAPVCCHNYGKFGVVVADDCNKFGPWDSRLTAKALLAGGNRFGGGSAIAAKRHVILTLPFSRDFKYCEDFEWWSRVIFSGVEVQYLGSSLVYYRTHTTNMTNSVSMISHFGRKLAVKLAKTAFLMGAAALMISLRSTFRVIFYCLRCYPSAKIVRK